jgi:hypothetical protein
MKTTWVPLTKKFLKKYGISCSPGQLKEFFKRGGNNDGLVFDPSTNQLVFNPLILPKFLKNLIMGFVKEEIMREIKKGVKKKTTELIDSVFNEINEELLDKENEKLLDKDIFALPFLAPSGSHNKAPFDIETAMRDL